MSTPLNETNRASNIAATKSASKTEKKEQVQEKTDALHPVQNPTKKSSTMANIVMHHGSDRTNPGLQPTQVSNQEGTEISSVDPTSRKNSNIVATEETGMSSVDSKQNLEK